MDTIPAGSTDAEIAKVKFEALVAELGREIRIFQVAPDSANSDESCATSTSQSDEPDDFYDLTAEDYYHLVGDKLGVQFLKTRKIREAEAAARKAKITKAIIRVRFPDGYVLEAKFLPSETIQCLMDLLTKVIACQDIPFYIYTVPPKRIMKEMSKDFYSAGFAPRAVVYFSYDLPEGIETPLRNRGPFLSEDIMSLKNIRVSVLDQKASNPPTDEAAVVSAETAPTSESKPASKAVTKAKPKWFKR